jgi:hypothetical protein
MLQSRLRLMPKGAVRGLTAGEWRALSPGLSAALKSAGVWPVIQSRTSFLARLAQIRFASAPVMVLGARVHWPDALPDFSLPGLEPSMAVLQHEMQHVLEFATGELSPFRYALRARNWRYRYEMTQRSRWRDFGAEQRASIAEHYWLLERGQVQQVARALGHPPAPLDLYRKLLPWAGREPRLEAVAGHG